jgi:predicted TIM-barrel fold metal-dependent hydrolase
MNPPGAAVQERVVVVSSDCHAGPSAVADYAPFVPRQYQEVFEDYVRAVDAYDADAAAVAAQQGGGLQHGGATTRADEGLWDVDVRTRHLTADGVVGEILFPQGGVPFAPYPAVGGGPIGKMRWSCKDEVRNAGPEIYNRWLAELCGADPDMHYGVAVLPIRDVDNAVSEVVRAKESGLNGGVSLPPVADDFPMYNDPAYEPLWAACEDTGMAINLHGGAGRFYGSGADASALTLAETDFFSKRTLWFLIFSGVFERHPRLHLAVTEQRAHWVPTLVAELDSIYKWPRSARLRAELPKLPSDYFATNCYVGASFFSRPECEMRSSTGVDRIMWGSDYPHTEGSWPWVNEALRWTFDGVDELELRMMLGGNAIACYRFNEDLLRRRAAQIGPTVEEITASPTTVPPHAAGAEYSWAWRTGVWH